MFHRWGLLLITKIEIEKALILIINGRISYRNESIQSSGNIVPDEKGTEML